MCDVLDKEWYVPSNQESMMCTVWSTPFGTSVFNEAIESRNYAA